MEWNQKVNHEMNFSENKQLRHPIIQKHKELLERLSDARVICVLHTEPNEFALLECCDGYYSYDLKQKDCLELSEIFKEIAAAICPTLYQNE